MIVTVPPQHGKSHGASRLLPAYLLGIDPKLRICIASYSFSLARRFGLGVQRVIQCAAYQRLFPSTQLKGMNGISRNDIAMRTADEFDLVAQVGGLKLVGREGSLTGNRVDVMILDDMYKDAAEANSPLIRASVWDWYCSVVRTRLHNGSRELIVCTRWHEDDLIGRLIQIEGDNWTVVNFPALKIGDPTELDCRKAGQALWPERHSAELLAGRRAIDPALFESLYQGNPTPDDELLYDKFATYHTISESIIRRAAYVDTADTGADYLCAIAYAVGQSGVIYVTDVVYSDRPMEATELMVAQLLTVSDTQICHIESNNGGRGFARAIARSVPRCRVDSFFQSANKVSRIVSNATQAVRIIRMPEDWDCRWRQFSHDLLAMRRDVLSSTHDDAADAVTGIVEKECVRDDKRIACVAFSGR